MICISRMFIVVGSNELHIKLRQGSDMIRHATRSPEVGWDSIEPLRT